MSRSTAKKSSRIFIAVHCICVELRRLGTAIHSLDDRRRRAGAASRRALGLRGVPHRRLRRLLVGVKRDAGRGGRGVSPRSREAAGGFERASMRSRGDASIPVAREGALDKLSPALGASVERGETSVSTGSGRGGGHHKVLG